MNNIQFTLKDCKIVELPKIHNPAGNITVIQNGSNFPFAIKRVYYLYDIPCDSERGGHAHKHLWQLILAASGSFILILDDGKARKMIQLNQPYKGLLIVPGIWREIINFSSGAVCLVLASHKYDEADYIRDYKEFIKYKNDSKLF